MLGQETRGGEVCLAASGTLNSVLTGCFDSKPIDPYVFIGYSVTVSRAVPYSYFNTPKVPFVFHSA
jgi:hypothetical protein